MNKALRKAIIAGNWKMNKNRKEAAELINALKPIAADKTCGVIIVYRLPIWKLLCL